MLSDGGGGRGREREGVGAEGRGGSLGVSRLGTPPEAPLEAPSGPGRSKAGKCRFDLKEKFQSLRSSRGGVLCWEDAAVANPPNMKVALYPVETSVKDDEGYKAAFAEHLTWHQQRQMRTAELLNRLRSYKKVHRADVPGS